MIVQAYMKYILLRIYVMNIFLGMMSYCLLTACRAEYTGCSPVLSLEGLKVQFPASLNPILATIYNIS